MRLAGIHSTAVQTAAIEPTVWQSMQFRWHETTQHIAKPSIDGALNRVGNWSNSAQHGLQSVMTQPLADWLQAHPYLAWAIDHPLIALGLLLVALLLLSGLLKAVARFTEQVWILLLRSPLALIQWLFAVLLRWVRHKPAPNTTITSQQERLALILQKLETMRQEQDELLQEVRAMLAAEESSQP